MQSKFLGGVLLIVGTSLGGGMLALPMVNAATGFWQSSLFLLLSWLAMTLGALFILEVNLLLPPGKHMGSMAYATLGKVGYLFTWLSYIFLLYSLLAAYISGGGDIFRHLFESIHIDLYPWQACLLFTMVFGFIVYGGIRKVDLLNRALMFGKLGVYLLLVILISPYIKPPNLVDGDYRNITHSVMVLITAFGFAIIVPNLRSYFNDNIPALKKVLYIGSFIPLACYLAWDAVIIGSVPSNGEGGLSSLVHSERAVSSLAVILSTTINNNFISSCFDFFTSICMLTTFLGVSLSLMTFLADNLNMQQTGKQGLGLFLLTFMPPFFLIIYYPGIYLVALNYAGVFCVILLLLLPALMSYYGRKKFTSSYQVPGGSFTNFFVILISVLLLINFVINFNT